jgi:hypothetical protein
MSFIGDLRLAILLRKSWRQSPSLMVAIGLVPAGTQILTGTRRNDDRYWSSTNNSQESVMPFLIPVLVGIPVLFGGGYVIYHFVH